ncbi:hypothetical protein B0H14DRAFT_2850410 [Mycena olivaceomarginata]|nr:hypothetical protein B0H14DRAFT_2850410 [Mycena olivaceomarginata]
MSSNGKGRGRAIRLRGGSDATHARPIVAFPVDRSPPHEAPAHPGRSWRSSPAPVPGPQAPSWHAAAPYATAPPPDSHGRQCSGVPRLAFVPDTPPHPQPQSRRRPIPIRSHRRSRASPASRCIPPSPPAARTLVVDFASWRPHTDTGSSAAWETPATSPPLPSLTIESPRLPWAITAHASGNVVRCGFADWEAMTRDGGHRPDLLTARLDAGGGLTRFAGLAESGAGCDVWVLEVA